MPPRLCCLVACTVLLGCAGPGGSPELQPPPRLAAPYFNIGVVGRVVSTDSPVAQTWFNRGLAQCFGFNHEEAVVCFEKAAAADPECAMAYWGKAYALGPNYNNMNVAPEAAQAAHQATQQALQHSLGSSDVEIALIQALSTRTRLVDGARRLLDLEYAEAMERLAADFPDDADVAALYAESLMNLVPWRLWSAEGEPSAETPRIRAVLEAALQRWPDHPALCHFYIHAMEASPQPGLAEAAADRLLELVPGMGHLRHMPSHIYAWTGRYADVVRSNQLGIEQDEAFAARAGRHNFYTLYRAHNYHFLAYGAMFEGRQQLALETSRKLVAEIPAELVRELADFLDIFVATPYHVMVRFGLWDTILAEPEPPADLQASVAVWRYARGVALASLGRTEEAGAEEAAFQRAREAVPATRLLFQNSVKSILAVADCVLRGEIAYRLRDYDQAFELLREAVELDVQLNYDEPWGWMEPARHALGALLVEQGRFDEAEAVYRANLERYPENGWALHGLAECLRGLDRHDEALPVEARFETAWQRADIEIPGSCFCRTGS